MLASQSKHSLIFNIIFFAFSLTVITTIVTIAWQANFIAKALSVGPIYGKAVPIVSNSGNNTTTTEVTDLATNNLSNFEINTPPAISSKTNYKSNSPSQNIKQGNIVANITPPGSFEISQPEEPSKTQELENIPTANSKKSISTIFNNSTNSSANQDIANNTATANNTNPNSGQGNNLNSNQNQAKEDFSTGTDTASQTNRSLQSVSVATSGNSSPNSSNSLNTTNNSQNEISNNSSISDNQDSSNINSSSSLSIGPSNTSSSSQPLTSDSLASQDISSTNSAIRTGGGGSSERQPSNNQTPVTLPGQGDSLAATIISSLQESASDISLNAGQELELVYTVVYYYNPEKNASCSGLLVNDYILTVSHCIQETKIIDEKIEVINLSEVDILDTRVEAISPNLEPGSFYGYTTDMGFFEIEYSRQMQNCIDSNNLLSCSHLFGYSAVAGMGPGHSGSPLFNHLGQYIGSFSSGIQEYECDPIPFPENPNYTTGSQARMCGNEFYFTLLS